MNLIADKFDALAIVSQPEPSFAHVFEPPEYNGTIQELRHGISVYGDFTNFRIQRGDADSPYTDIRLTSAQVTDSQDDYLIITGLDANRMPARVMVMRRHVSPSDLFDFLAQARDDLTAFAQQVAQERRR